MVTRYMATILNGSKNPHCAAVMSDITNAILKKHASEGEQGAEYWDQKEQEQWLVHAYDKWAAKGTIWSVASGKVSQLDPWYQQLLKVFTRFTRNSSNTSTKAAYSAVDRTFCLMEVASKDVTRHGTVSSEHSQVEL